MPDSTEMILPSVREMRAELLAFHQETMECFDAVDRRLAAIEAEQTCLWQAVAERTLLRKSVVGALALRLDRLEQQLGLLELPS